MRGQSPLSLRYNWVFAPDAEAAEVSLRTYTNIVIMWG